MRDTEDGHLLGAGNTGLYRVVDSPIQPIVRFADAEQVTANGLQWRWAPSDLLELGGDRYLIGGLFGGIDLLELRANRKWTLTSVDDRVGEPITF